MSIKKRLALGAGAVATVGAVATLVAGVTFGLFSASQTGATNTFTAGTVTLTNPVNASCTISPMAPGDSSAGYTPVPAGQTDPQTAACTFAVTYGGNLPAYLGVDAAVGGTGLYDASATGLQFQIGDGTTSYATGGALNGTSNLLVSTTPDAANSSKVHTFTVNYALPTASPNSYQGKNTTLTLTVHAVQSGNNNFVGGCTAGQSCGVAANWS
jgi:hypothetical protein